MPAVQPVALLPLPTQRPVALLDSMARALPERHESYALDHFDAIGTHLGTPEGRDAISLALDLVRGKALQGRTARVLIVRTAVAGELAAAAGTALTDSLRIAARLVRDGLLDEDQAAEWTEDVRTERWAGRLVHAVRGLSPGAPARCPLATEDELAGAAAVVAFAVTAPGSDLIHHGIHTASAAAADGPLYRSLRNTHLADLLRTRPEDLHRVTVYVAERGMDPENSEAVERLRGWLDEDVAAVGDGWL